MDFNQLIWIVPLTLLVIAVLQILYVLWLTATLGPRSKRSARQPGAPVMPTSPSGVNAPSAGNASSTLKAPGGKMVVLSGLRNVAEVPIPSNRFAIGRFYNPDQNVLIALDDKSISRRHALFEGDDSLREYYLTDTNSSYGTAVRKENKFELVTPGRRERIYNEDVVQFGNSVTVRFVLPCDTRAASTRL